MNFRLRLLAHAFLLLDIIFLPNLVIAHVSPSNDTPGHLSLFLICRGILTPALANGNLRKT